MSRFIFIFISTLFVYIGNCWASDGNTDRSSLAIKMIKTSCISGDQLDIKNNGEGGILVSKAGSEDSLSVAKAEVKSLVTSANEQIRAEGNADIRQCMQSYTQKILGVISTPASKPKQKVSLPVKQWIPLDMPMPMLDGTPLLTLAKVYEYERDEAINLVIEIPHRTPYRIKLWQSKNPHRKNFDTFKYKNTIYKIVADYIDLQGQRAQVSVFNYKKAM